MWLSFSGSWQLLFAAVLYTADDMSIHMWNHKCIFINLNIGKVCLSINFPVLFLVSRWSGSRLEKRSYERAEKMIIYSVTVCAWS